MPKIPGVNHLQAVRALEKAGFRIVRQGKHIVMSDGTRFLTIPRANPVNQSGERLHVGRHRSGRWAHRRAVQEAALIPLAI